jgi:nucleoside-diphosphate-sugar epimerase
MSTILVTGATGLIGSHAVAALAARGHAVVASGRDRAALAKLDGVAARTVAADLALDALAPLLEGVDVVVHCAARSSPWGRAADFHRDNVQATLCLLAAAHAAGVRRFVHLGSPSIYFRFADQLAVGEDFVPPRRWITDYARSKWESELAVRAAARDGLPALVLRPRAVFGAGDRAILPRILAVAARGRFPLVNGGRALIDVTTVANAADAIVAAVEAGSPGDGRAYNISNGAPLTVRALLEQLFAAMKMDVELRPVPRALALALAGAAETVANLRPGRPEPRLTRYGVGVIGYSQTLDIRRARAELGYAPRQSVQDGLAIYADACRRERADGGAR